MEDKDDKKPLPSIITAGILFIIMGGFLIYGFLQISALIDRANFLTTELELTTSAISHNINELSRDIIDLRAETVGLSSTLSNTQQHIDAVKTQVGGVEQAVGSISGTVGDLQKLSKIDLELLKKYSKVYFMNENYVPVRLTDIPGENLYSERDSQQFLTEVWPFLRELLDAAEKEGATIYVKSAYRSFGKQESLKSAYTVTYGAGTSNAFSADQGYSEHQLGTTVDFITTGLGGSFAGFEKTDAYSWLKSRAHIFGFALSYPENNSYYIYEPWHWRFVGVKLATYLRNNNLSFYDVGQREIDTYLINFFD